MRTENNGAHHQANPDCAINTPNANPNGTKPTDTANNWGPTVERDVINHTFPHRTWHTKTTKQQVKEIRGEHETATFHARKC